MAVIPEYRSIEEKNRFYDYRKIDNISDFQKLEGFNTSGTFFRGMHEAKYKIFSSGQRAWFTKELWNLHKSYDEFILKSINEAKKFDNGLLFDFLYPNINDFAFLAFLQHYGAPTPLIDFTHDFFIGLFFSIDGLKYYPSDRDIDNYFSLYALPNQKDLIDLKNLLINSIRYIQNIESEIQGLSDEEIENHIASISNPDFSFAREMNNPFFVSFSNGSVDKNWEHVLKIDSSLNIIAQKGLLVNNPDFEKPLEEIFDGYNFWNWEKDNPDKEICDRLFFPRIKCLDIHKSLEIEVREYLKRNNITRERMYPEEEVVVKKIMENVMVK